MVWDFPGHPVVKTPSMLPMQRTQVQIQVWELRSYILCGLAKRFSLKNDYG